MALTGRCIFVSLIALLLALSGNSAFGQPASSPPSSVAIGWVNVGASSNEALMFANKMVEQNMSKTQVKWVEFTAGALALAALQSNNIQIMTEVGLPPTSVAIARGVPFKIVWINDIYLTAEGLAARNGAGIRSVRDLQGKRVATLVGSSSGYMLHAALKSVGLDESKLELINMDPTAMEAAWKNRQIDAAYIWEPVLSDLVANGGTIIGTNKDYQNLASSVDMTLVNLNFAKAHPDIVVALLRAENASIVAIHERTDESMQKMGAYLKIPVSKVKAELDGIQLMDVGEQLSQNGFGQGAGIKTSRLTKALILAAEYLKEVGIVKTAPTPGQIAGYIDASFAAQVK